MIPDTSDQSFVQRVSPFIHRGLNPKAAHNYHALLYLSRLLADAVASELRSNRYIFLDWPAHPNIGDQAIYVGTAHLLNRQLNAECIYASSFHEFNAEGVRKLPADVPILFHGGGNLGDLWSEHQKFRESVLQLFPERRFILLPQTMHFQDPAELERASTWFRQAKLTIFLRDFTSYHAAVKHFGAERVRLAPDMAFSLIGLMPRIIAAMKVKPEAEVLYMLRDDKESTKNPPAVAEGSLVSDWPQHDTLNRLMKKPVFRQPVSGTGMCRHFSSAASA